MVAQEGEVEPQSSRTRRSRRRRGERERERVESGSSGKTLNADAEPFVPPVAVASPEAGEEAAQAAEELGTAYEAYGCEDFAAGAFDCYGETGYLDPSYLEFGYGGFGEDGFLPLPTIPPLPLWDEGLWSAEAAAAAFTTAEGDGKESPRTSLLTLCGAWGALATANPGGQHLCRLRMLGFREAMSRSSRRKPPRELKHLRCERLEQ
eukprot:TRINITY_DN6517_c0_g2_i2.p1 TRINITY_DN6517_c0_g2~~TRINITY_DN6517_c0_g2_i2.p1  ORF type:complete len:242 (+),score=51.11 TRINITY_DN6517_c0_g2_i2:106-726(+)